MDPLADRSSAEAFQHRSLLEADRLACGLRAAREWLALPLARAAQEFVRQNVWLPFGFSRLEDFTRERLGRSGRWLRDLASLQVGLDAFPELASAMVGGDGGRPLGRVATLWISRTARTESISTWVRVARESSVRDLRELIREARRTGSCMPPCRHAVIDAAGETPAALLGEAPETAAEAYLGVAAEATAEALLGVSVRAAAEASANSSTGAAADADVFQRRCRGRLAVPAAVRVAFDEALDFHRAISGSETSVAEFADAVAAEWDTAPLVNCEPARDVTLVALRRDRRRDEKERACDRARGCAPVDAEPAAAAQDVLRRVREVSLGVWHPQPTPVELAEQLQSLVQLEDEIERRLGSLLAGMDSRRAWSSLGFASLGHYANERLGLARRTLETRAELARALSRLPVLREAYEGGRIGVEAALLVRRALGSGRVDAQLEQEWTEHASCVTVKRLRDELRLLRRRAAGLEHEVGSAEGAGGCAPEAIAGTCAREEGAGECALASERAARRRSPRPPSDAAWHASLFRVSGLARERVARLGTLAIESSAEDGVRSDNHLAADVSLALELPEDVAQRFFAAVESARLLLGELVTSRDVEAADPPSLHAAQTFSKRGAPVPAWVGLLAVLEHFVDTWDRPEHVPRREWDAIYRRDGYRCMAPGCTARADLQAHHVWYRSHQGPDDAWNMLCLCWLHHQEGEHGELARVRGQAPLGLVWRLGTQALASWYRNERRVDGGPELRAQRLAR